MTIDTSGCLDYSYGSCISSNFSANQTVKRQATHKIAASFQGIRNEDCKMRGSKKNYSEAWVSEIILIL